MTKTARGPGLEESSPVDKGRSLGTNHVGNFEDCIFTSDFIFATLANFANAFGMQMLVATLPVYVIGLGGSPADAGLVTGALSFMALLFRPFVGWLTDAWRRRPLVLIGTSCYGVASGIYLLAGSIPLLVLGRFVHGFGLCCYTTASNAYIADIAPHKRRAESVGLFSAAQALGLIIGPVVGFMLIGATGFRYLFYFTGGLAFTAFAISIFTRERRQIRKIIRRPWSPRRDIVAVEALPVAWMALCMGMGFGTLNAFISIFAQSRGLQNPGFYFMVQAVSLLISRAFAGRLADRHSRAAAILPGIILMVAALALLPPARGLVWFIVSASFFGFGFGMAQPATMALLIDRVLPEKRGLATGTYFTGFDAGISVGSILLGVAGEHWGFGVMWLISALFTLLGLAGLLADRNAARPGAEPQVPSCRRGSGAQS
jgi:MFS family permease